jgi:protein involved in polysaccharide export with SLBB domain
LNRRLLALGSVLQALVLPLSGPSAAAEAYQLGSLDRVRVIVSEWSANGSEVTTRLSGEFTVNAAGQLSLPLIGEVPAAGQTVTALSQVISAGVQARSRLINPPVTSVEIVQYRPFYIVGFVERPGEYPFRPGMTVLQSLAVAGGVFRAPNASFLRLERDAVSATGDFGLNRARLDELVMRRARLQAELEHKDGMQRPTELNGSASDELFRREEQTLGARREALASFILGQEELRRLARDQEASLRNQVTAQEQRLAIVTREADEIRSLRARGLVTSARDFTVASAAAEIEARLRELQTQILRAQQDVAMAGHAITRLRDERRLELRAELERTEAGIVEARRRMQTATELLAEASAAAETSGLMSPAQQMRGPGYIVIRQVGDQIQELPGSDATAVLPGDVIRVILPARPEQPSAPPRIEGGRG